jgi:DNA repair protein RadC
MERQLEFWSQNPEEPPKHETASENHLIANEQASTSRGGTFLFTNPDRQHDYNGVPHEQWPAPEVNRDSITIDRIRNDIDGPAHRFEIRRHDYVEVYIDAETLQCGYVVGISNTRQQVRVAIEEDDAETWFDTACVFPAIEREMPKRNYTVTTKVGETRESLSVQEEVAMRIHKQTQYTSLKIVSLVRVGSMKGRHRLTTTREACDFFRQYWQENPSPDQERFVVAYLDTKHTVQCVVVITQGTLDASLVHPREVFKPAIIEGSNAVCLSHNHPSGDPTPSREDHAVTERLTEAGKLLGITVLDHVVVADGTNEAVSLREC